MIVNDMSLIGARGLVYVISLLCSFHIDEDNDEDENDDDDVEGISKESRSEKKSRKAMQKLGMKATTGVSCVTVNKSETVIFVISKPYAICCCRFSPKNLAFSS
ncbi:hypothetical protein QYE76_057853 [Lolium multiflorum]|uniref:NAC-A/B domain-containing protein n=1 Tax=Lolium multiflorum TaxID=4521 RepID=A0AAD8T503_LOLMU|nr:hypothetical protein QYE76_057853 [Lolium multiflorum]